MGVHRHGGIDVLQRLDHFSDGEQTARFAIRQRLEHDGIDQGKERRRGADAEGEPENRDQRERRSAQQGADREPEILRKRVPPWQPARRRDCSRATVRLPKSRRARRADSGLESAASSMASERLARNSASSWRSRSRIFQGNRSRNRRNQYIFTPQRLGDAILGQRRVRSLPTVKLRRADVSCRLR